MIIKRPSNSSKRPHSSILVRQLTGQLWLSFTTKTVTTATHLRISSKLHPWTRWRVRSGTISVSYMKNASSLRKPWLLTPRCKIFRMETRTLWKESMQFNLHSIALQMVKTKVFCICKWSSQCSDSLTLYPFLRNTRNRDLTKKVKEVKQTES